MGWLSICWRLSNVHTIYDYVYLYIIIMIINYLWISIDTRWDKRAQQQIYHVLIIWNSKNLTTVGPFVRGWDCLKGGGCPVSTTGLTSSGWWSVRTGNFCESGTAGFNMFQHADSSVSISDPSWHIVITPGNQTWQCEILCNWRFQWENHL